MPTSIHLPKPLLDAVDRRAKAQRVSRNRFIVRTLEKELESSTDWSKGFFDQLADVDPEDAVAIDDMLEAIRAARKSKGPGHL